MAGQYAGQKLPGMANAFSMTSVPPVQSDRAASDNQRATLLLFSGIILCYNCISFVTAGYALYRVNSPLQEEVRKSSSWKYRAIGRI